MYERVRMPQEKAEAPNRQSPTASSAQLKSSGASARPVTADEIAALQRSAGNQAASRILAQRRAEQRAAEDSEYADPSALVDEATSSPGATLEGASLHRAQSFYRNESLSAARFYTGPAAQRAVEAFGAEAITVGTHVLLGRRAEHDERIIGHELGHVDKNTRGEIETGTDHGAGVAVTDPRQASERTAETDGAAYAAGTSTAPSVAQRATAGHPPATDSSSACSDDSVQRYTTVHPIDSEYPEMGRQSPGGTRSTVRRGDFFDTSGDDFFPGQDMQPRTVRTQAGESERESFVDDSGQPNIVYKGQVPLNISDNLDLAVEHTSDGRQAKMFFATDEQISKANTLLQGKVKLEKSGSHYLAITRGSVSTTLWRVQPVVARGPSARHPQGTVEHGLDVNLPQRCNEMAKAVSGQEGLADHGTDAYFEALANILAEVKHKKAPRAKDYAKAKKEAGRDPAKIGKYSQVMQQLIEGVLSHQGEEPLEAAIKKYRLNQYTPPAAVGDVLMTKTQRPVREAGDFDFHFASVVATSGSDSVTMENYARHEEEKATNDPQWYFAMHGTARSLQSFHEQWGHLDDGGRVRLTILMRR